MISPKNNIRALEALDLRRRGRKLADIAASFGITKERVRQLSVRGLKLERELASDDPWYELSTRARNALLGTGCEPTPASVLEYRTTVGFTRVPALGVKTIKEINDWLTRYWREAIG
jgi:hypothetical protein